MKSKKHFSLGLIVSCALFILTFLLLRTYLPTQEVFAGTTFHVDPGPTCSMSSSCGTAGTPCCTLGAMDDSSLLTPGDTVEIHGGTYTHTSGGTYANLDTSNVTWTVSGSDVVIIDLENIATRGLAINGDNVIIDVGSGSLTVTDKKDSNSDSIRHGCIHANGDNITIDGVRCENPNGGTTGTISSYVCWYATGNGLLLENTECEGEFNTGFYLNGVMKNDADSGIIVRNNLFESTRSDFQGLSTGVILQDTGSNNNAESVAIYNNTFDYSAAASTVTRRAFYVRTGGAPFYIFNNHAIDASIGFYFQNNEPTFINQPGSPWDSERHKIFNNTIEARQNQSLYGVLWPNCIASEVWVTNNIFTNFYDGVRLQSPCEYGTNTSPERSLADRFTNNVCYNTTQCYNLQAGPTVTNNNLLTGNPFLTSNGHIQSGSSANNTGYNNPINQGAGSCSILTRGETINCAVDVDGEIRGAAWDIGMDELGSASGPVCGNNIVESGEVCDGSSLNGATCQTQGYTSGTLSCNGSCSGYITSSCSSSTGSLLSRFHFDGNFTDLYGGTPGTCSGSSCPTLTTGQVGSGAYQFDGINDFVTVNNPSYFELTGNITVAAWVRNDALPSGWAGANVVVGKGETYNTSAPFSMRITGGEALCFDQSNGSGAHDNLCTANSVVPIGQWTHLAMTRSGTTRSLYIDGSLQHSSSVQTQAPTASGDPLTIGAVDTTATEFFTGTIDDVRIYNYALSQSEITSLATLSPSCTESWSCSAWSTCANGSQTRTCTDANACGTTTNMPSETQSCISGPVCGNNVKESGEVCDGTDLNGQSCITQGYSGGPLSCNSSCSGYITTSCAVSFTKKDTNPSITISSPTSGTTISGSSVTVTANANDDMGVSKVQFQLNGIDLGPADISAPYAISWNTLSSTDGTHTLRAIATDTIGQTGTSPAISVTVDNTGPVISSITAENITSSFADISWNTNELADAAIEYGIDTNYGSSVADTNLDTAHTLALQNLLPETTYHFRVISTDDQQNQSVSADMTVTTLAIAVGSCTENWSCSTWSACSSGRQTRTCTDSNACGTTTSQPPEVRTCTTPAPTSTGGSSSSGGGGGGSAVVIPNTEAPTIVSPPENLAPSSGCSSSSGNINLSEEDINATIARERSRERSIVSSLIDRVKGYILLQVEEFGESWYLDPVSRLRYYLANGSSAYTILERFGLGITNADLEKIPVGLESRFEDCDTDGDGLPDRLEEGLFTDINNPDTDGDGYSDGDEVAAGYSPIGPGKPTIDQSLVNRLKGRILLQVEELGQAWYIHPISGLRYYMKDGNAAYQIMRFLSLGITNQDLSGIPIGE